MSVSKFLLTLSILSIGFMAACGGPGTYPISGERASPDDPVHEMNMTDFGYRGEVR